MAKTLLTTIIFLSVSSSVCGILAYLISKLLGSVISKRGVCAIWTAVFVLCRCSDKYSENNIAAKNSHHNP